MAEMKNICGKILLDLHEKVRAEIELKESSTQLFIQQVIEEHFNRLEGKGEENMEKRTLAVQISEELFQRVKWAVTKERVKQKDFIIAIIKKAVAEVEAKWQELERAEAEEETQSEAPEETELLEEPMEIQEEEESEEEQETESEETIEEVEEMEEPEEAEEEELTEDGEMEETA